MAHDMKEPGEMVWKTVMAYIHGQMVDKKKYIAKMETYKKRDKYTDNIIYKLD